MMQKCKLRSVSLASFANFLISNRQYQKRKWLLLCYTTPIKRIKAQRVSAYSLFLIFKEKVWRLFRACRHFALELKNQFQALNPNSNPSSNPYLNP